MDKDLKRALRRHHVNRLKKKRVNYYGGYARELPERERLRTVGVFVNTVPVCSCWMCGNPRRHLGDVTLQETVAAKAFAMAVAALGED